MNSDIYNMLKKVFLFDLILGILLAFAIYALAKAWLLYFIFGLLLAYLSLVLNTIITNASIGKEGKPKVHLIILGFVLRVLLICIIGIVIYVHNTSNMIAYIAGYSVQFISLTFYGLTNK